MTTDYTSAIRSALEKDHAPALVIRAFLRNVARWKSGESATIPALNQPPLPPPSSAIAPTSSPAAAPAAASALPLDRPMAEIERLLLTAQLKKHDGNRAAVAAAMGWSRRTVLRKMQEFGLD